MYKARYFFEKDDDGWLVYDRESNLCVVCKTKREAILECRRLNRDHQYD